jgi:hypothetical protein
MRAARLRTLSLNFGAKFFFRRSSFKNKQQH